MSTTPNDETDLVLGQLRLLRAEMNARFDALDAHFDEFHSRFKEVREEIAGSKGDLRGWEFDTIPEVYTANLTVASFVDYEWRFVLSSRKERS